MLDQFAFQRTPSQFAWLILYPTEVAAWLDEDSLPFENMYMPSGAAFIAIGVDELAFPVNAFPELSPPGSVLPDVPSVASAMPAPNIVIPTASIKTAFNRGRDIGTVI